jgi:hypothetical protein
MTLKPRLVGEMTRLFATLMLCLGTLMVGDALAEKAVFGQPLKKEYVYHGSDGEPVGFTKQTGATADGFSVICDMGQAMPSLSRDGWYENKPIPGLRLEFRARAAKRHRSEYFGWDLIGSAGFVVVTKNNEVIKVFNPNGKHVGKVWTGDALHEWGAAEGTDLDAFDGSSGTWARFDFMDGMGFYYEQGNSKPKYFLSNCRKIKKANLPIYETHFD